jgi:hypothetical protein
MASDILLIPRGRGIDGKLVIPVPSIDVITTTLVVSAGADRLPTLSSVEKIVGKLASVGLVLEKPEETDKIAHLVNKYFLPVEPAKWSDQRIKLDVVRADGEGEPEALRAVSALRGPTLNAADFVLQAAGSYGPTERRANEIQLVDNLSAAVVHRKPVWATYGKQAMSFVLKTALPTLVEQLVGIPISDLIRSTFKGAERLVF